MSQIENDQNNFDLQGKDKVNGCKESIESRERVWKNLEVILEQFEQDLLRSKEELKGNHEYSRPKNYFNWDIMR